MGFYYYFPRQETLMFCGAGFGEVVPGCEGEYTGTADLRELSRTFGSEALDCSSPDATSPTDAPKGVDISASSKLGLMTGIAIAGLVAFLGQSCMALLLA